MRSHDQRSRIRYVKADYVPGTDVLAVEKKEIGSPSAAPPPNPDPTMVRDSKSGRAILDTPMTGQSGRAPEPPAALVTQ